MQCHVGIYDKLGSKIHFWTSRVQIETNAKINKGLEKDMMVFCEEYLEVLDWNNKTISF